MPSEPNLPPTPEAEELEWPNPPPPRRTVREHEIDEHAADAVERRKTHVKHVLGAAAKAWGPTGCSDSQFPAAALRDAVVLLDLTEHADDDVVRLAAEMFGADCDDPCGPVYDRAALAEWLAVLPFRSVAKARSPLLLRDDGSERLSPKLRRGSFRSAEPPPSPTVRAPTPTHDDDAAAPPAEEHTTRTRASGEGLPDIVAYMRDSLQRYRALLENAQNDPTHAGVVAAYQSMARRGIDTAVQDLLSVTLADPNMSLHVALGTLEKGEPPQVQLERRGSACRLSTTSSLNTDGVPRGSRRSALTPFASVLAMQHTARSLSSPWHLGGVALLFIDISGYSAVAAQLGADRPFELSAVVNGYLHEIVQVTHRWGGDVLKFAGDALLVGWHAAAASPEKRLAGALACAVELIEKHCDFRVPDTDTTLGLHIGVAQGELTSRLLLPSTEGNQTAMPAAFHFLGGRPLSAVMRACAVAARGEAVIARDEIASAATPCEGGPEGCETMELGGCVRVQLGGFSEDAAGAIATEEFGGDVRLARKSYATVRGAEVLRHGDLACGPRRAPRPVRSVSAVPLFRRMGNALASCVRGSTVSEPKGDGIVVDEILFVPPRVAEQMAIGADPLMIAQNRELVVLFVRMGGRETDPHRVTASVDPTVWFQEVHGVLRRNGAAVVQLIDDDKGVHLVAAFNMYAVSHDAGDRSMTALMELRAARCEAYVGVAAGRAFCGVLGSPLACQWDIQGAAVVRACRLMQHAAAVAGGPAAVIDASVYEILRDKSVITELEGGAIRVKGTEEPLQCYQLVPSVTPLQRGASRLRAALHQARSAADLLELSEGAPAESIHQQLERRPTVPFAVSAGPESGGSVRTPELYFAHTLSIHVHAEAIAKVRGVVQHGHGPSGKRAAVLRGPAASGKFSVILNALEGTGFTPLVHECDDSAPNLALLRTVATWFAVSVNPTVGQQWRDVLQLLGEGRITAAFDAGLRAMRWLGTRKLRVAIVARRVQFLDACSLSFLTAVREMLCELPSVAVLVTCYPIYGLPAPHTLFGLPPALGAGNSDDAAEDAGDGVLHLVVTTVAPEERLALVCHCLQNRCDEWLVEWIAERSAAVVGYTKALCEYMLRKGALSMSASGAYVANRAALPAIEMNSWVDIAPHIAAEVMQQIDRLSPQLLMECKIVAAITEQPGITAFYYSVNRASEAVVGHELDVVDIRLLEGLWMLRETYHRCTAHKNAGTGDRDAAMFYIQPLRDIVLATLTPQQRTQINSVCAAVYADTHPMDHPMQLLVRARHHLFAVEMAEYCSDIARGFRMIDEPSMGFDAAERDRLKHVFFDWIEAYPKELLPELFSERDYQMYDAMHEARSVQFAIVREAPANDHAQGIAVAQRIRQLLTTWAPLSMGPAREYLNSVLAELGTIQECVNDAAARVDAQRFSETVASSSAAEERVTIPLAVMQRLLNALRDYKLVLTHQAAPMWSGAEPPPAEEVAQNAAVAAMVNQLCAQLQAQYDATKAVARAFNTPPPSAERVERARQFMSDAVELLYEHVTEGLPRLCELFEGHSAAAIIGATRDLAAEITSCAATTESGHRAYHLSRVAAVVDDKEDIADGVLHVLDVYERRGDDLSQDTSMLVALYTSLPQILGAYCPSSPRLSTAFREGVRALHQGLLGLEAHHRRVRMRFLVFIGLWVTCCREVTLFT